MLRRNPITVHQFQQWHPENLLCDTDFAYTKLANAIYEELEYWLEFMEPKERPGVAIGLAHYIEDIISETHQMEVFMKLYKEMYGYTLPFFDDDSERTELHKMAFVLWHCICAQRDGRFINPVTGTVLPAEKMMHFVDDARTKYGCKPNEDLAGYLYSEDTLDDPMLLKTVLMWIEHRSFLGRWQDNNPKDDPNGLQKMFPQADPHLVTYGNGSIQAFDHQAWPLSLQAKHIYAEMIRMDMDDPDDEIAQEVENIQFRKFGMYHGLKVVGRNILMEDSRKEQFLLDASSGEVNLIGTFRTKKYVMGAFFQYRGLWNVCGANSWLDITTAQFEEWAKDVNKTYSFMHDYEHQYDDYIEKHNGRRLFFFKDFAEYQDWLRKDLGVKVMPKECPAEWRDDTGLVVFFEPNGQTTVSIYGQLITDDDNPYYNEKEAESGQFEIASCTNYVSPTFLEYALANNKLPLGAINDRRGAEYGWQIFQNNIEFFARCLRRDIKNPNVFCPRKNLKPTDWPRHKGLEPGVMTKSQFLYELNSNTHIRSKASKIWEVVRADDRFVILEDKRGNEVCIETNGLYRAYYDLYGTGDCSTSAVAPYVPKNQLSAATAIIYSLLGNGRAMRNLHKLFAGKGFEEIAKMLAKF